MNDRQTMIGYLQDLPEPHSFSEYFPLLEGEAFSELVTDIRENGLLEPIVLFEGKILDGRNRLRACKEADVQPRFIAYEGSPGLAALHYVVSRNVKRRHLNATQRALIAQKLLPVFERLGAIRMRQGAKPDPAQLIEQGSRPERSSAARAGALLDVNRATVAQVKRMSVEAPELIPAMERGDLSAAEAERQLRHRKKVVLLQEIERKKAQSRPLPTGPFDVIVSDPPWPVDFSLPYPTMSLEDIIAKWNPNMVAEDCVLWLWHLNSNGADAYRCVTAWGFTPRTVLTWHKGNGGLGSPFRSVTEHCIVATRGNPILKNIGLTTLLIMPKRENSRKPEAFYQIVEATCLGTSRLEMFARETRPGWVPWGLETNKFDLDTGRAKGTLDILECVRKNVEEQEADLKRHQAWLREAESTRAFEIHMVQAEKEALQEVQAESLQQDLEIFGIEIGDPVDDEPVKLHDVFVEGEEIVRCQSLHHAQFMAGHLSGEVEIRPVEEADPATAT